jgi:hypothetical protein
MLRLKRDPKARDPKARDPEARDPEARDPDAYGGWKPFAPGRRCSARLTPRNSAEDAAHTLENRSGKEKLRDLTLGLDSSFRLSGTEQLAEGAGQSRRAAPYYHLFTAT